MLLQIQKLRPRVLWTLAFLGLLVLAVNATIFLSIKTSQRLLDQELGKRLEGTAQIAGLLVKPEHFAALVRMADEAATGETPPPQRAREALADTNAVDFVAQMDALDAADLVRDEWRKLAQGADASNVLLLDSRSRVLLRLRQPFAYEPDMMTLDPPALTRALIGEAAHSSLYEKDGEFLRSGYAPVFDTDGSVVGAVVVEGASSAFRPLTLVRTSLYATAVVASLLVVLIGLGFIRTVGHLGSIEGSLRHVDTLATVGQVAAGAAHEIRNPLAVVRGAAARLKRGDSLSPAERADLLRMIDDEVTRIAGVVQSLLDLARRPVGEWKVFALKPVLLRSLEMLRVELERSKVALEVEWNAPDDLRVEGDPGALHHIFLNLALNSREAMPGGGKLTVRVEARRGEVRLYFDDTGPGVPIELRSKIFLPFFTTRAKGTGLGLALVDRVVSEHEGSVRVGAAPGGGAEFEIRLPAQGA